MQFGSGHFWNSKRCSDAGSCRPVEADELRRRRGKANLLAFGFTGPAVVPCATGTDAWRSSEDVVCSDVVVP